jgi:hypothetical protein
MPPVASTSLQLLPLASLTPPNLERLCLRLGEKEGEVQYAGVYGLPGQAQKGIDVLVRLSDGKYVLIQSRRIKEVTASGLREAVTDFLEGDWPAKASSFIYATSTSAARTKIQDEIAAQSERLAREGIGFDVWDEDRLSRKLKDHPDLVADFFGVDVLRAFLPDQAGPALAQQLVQELTPRLETAVSGALQRERGEGHGPSMPEAAEGLLDLILVTGELAPDIKEILEELKATSRTEAAHLASYVRDDARRARDLIRDPQSWVQRGSWQLHNALGLLANAAGMFEDAERAFLRAQERSPAAERPLLLMRARDAAENDDRPEDAKDLFERARDLNEHLIAVRVLEIRALPDPEARLDELNGLTTRTDRERNSVDAARIDLLLDLDRWEEALDLLNTMLQRTPDSLFALDRRAGLVFRRAATKESGAKRDPVALRQAAENSLRVRDRLRPRGRTLEAGRSLGRAAECMLLAGDSERAHKLLDSATDAELAHREVRSAVAQAVLHSGRPDEALAVLGDEASWTLDDRLIAAHALALSDDHDAHERATALVRPLLHDEDRGAPAALAMVAAAAFDIEMAWPSDAADVLTEASPAAAAHLHAERLAREGREDEAERLLQRHADDPEILRSLVERALDAENWGRGLTLAERLVRNTGRGDDRMLLARALKRADKTDRLKQELNALAGDVAQPPQLRGRAFAALSAELPDADNVALDELTERWLRELPHDVEGQWQRTWVLARLARYEEAFALIDQNGLRATTLNHAHLMAATFVRSLKPVDAARRIAELSDQFDRQDERLEGLFLFTATRTKEQLDEQLGARLAETFRTFSERFPQSTAVRSFSIDEEDPESILEVIRSQFDPEREQHRQEMAEQVADGNAPLAYLAEMTSRPIPTLMQRLFQVPLAYGHPEEWDRELELARAAIGGPAVWDPTSLTVVAGMPEQLRRRVMAALPGSVLAYSSLQDSDQADAALDDRDEEERIAPAGEGLRMTVIGHEELTREREVVKGAFELARELTTVANTDADEPDELDELFKDEERGTHFNTFPATISVARRRGLPIYSDDRYVRQMAHRERIETFGSIAVLGALLERQDVDADAVALCRLDLLRHGAVGLRPTGGEIAALAEEYADQPVGRWLAALLDPTGWRNDPDELLRQCMVFLRHIWSRQPNLLPDWAARVLDCANQAVPHGEEFYAQVALVYVWFTVPQDEDAKAQRAFVSTLVDAFEEAPRKLNLRHFENLVGKAIGVALQFGERGNTSLRPWMVLTIVRQLRFPLDAQVLLAFWNSV